MKQTRDQEGNNYAQRLEIVGVRRRKQNVDILVIDTERWSRAVSGLVTARGDRTATRCHYRRHY